MNKTYHKRRLPHWHPPNAVYDLCFRLDGTLPKYKWHELKEIRDRKIEELKKSTDDENEIQIALRNTHELFFGKFDALLDKGDFGPTYLRDPKIAEIIAEAFHYRHEQGHFKLICFSIMPNHVHAIFYKLQKPLSKIMESMKRHTARQANIILDRTGNSFWQPESYDHVIRNRASLKRKINYHMNNPVVAGLCSHWSFWHGNYINPDFKHWL